MELSKLGGSSLRVSPLGLGALHFGVFLSQAEADSLVGRALDLGLNFIDTAPIYGNGRSESMVGKAVGRRRGEVIISTKAGLEAVTREDGSFGVEVSRMTPGKVRASVEQSLLNLGTDYVDLFQLHAFDRSVAVEETLGELSRLVGEGKVRYVGCSNFSPEEVTQTLSASSALPLTRLVSVQCHYNIIERRAGEALGPLCRDQGMSLICNRALARGVLSGRYRPGAAPPEDSRGAISPRIREGLTPKRLDLVSRLRSIAENIGATLPVLSLAWLMARPRVSLVLIGVRTWEQLEDCTRALSLAWNKEIAGTVEEVIDASGQRGQVQSLPEVFLEK